jgi:hypothetical protein
MASPLTALRGKEARKVPTPKPNEKPKVPAKARSTIPAKREPNRPGEPKKQAKAQAMTASLAPLVGTAPAVQGTATASSLPLGEAAGSIWRSMGHLFDGLKEAFAPKGASPKTSESPPPREKPSDYINREAVEELRKEIEALKLSPLHKGRLAELANTYKGNVTYFLDKGGNDLSPVTYWKIARALPEFLKPLTRETDPLTPLRQRTLKALKEMEDMKLDPKQIRKILGLSEGTLNRFIAGADDPSRDLTRNYISSDLVKKLTANLEAFDKTKNSNDV